MKEEWQNLEERPRQAGRPEGLEWKNLESQPYTKGSIITFQQNPYTSPPLSMWGGKVFWQATIALCGILCAALLAAYCTWTGYWWETAYQVWLTAVHCLPFFFFQRSSLRFWLEMVYGKEQRDRYLFSALLVLIIIGGGILYLAFLFMVGWAMAAICIANPTF